VRVGYIGHFGAWHTELEVANALEMYARVHRYHYSQLDRQRFTEREYDLVLTSLPHKFSLGFWRAQKGIKVAHYFDLVQGFCGRDKIYFPALRAFDLVLSPDGIDSGPYEQAGIKRQYFQQGYDPGVYHPVQRECQRDVGFIGHAYNGRGKLLKRVSRRFNLEHVGQSNECQGENHAAFCASSRVMLAPNAGTDVPGYWSIRVYLHLACRAFVLHQYVAGIEEEFTDGEHLVLWRDEKDLLSKIAYYLEHPGERERIAAAGHEHVQRYMWDERVKSMWRLITDLK